MEWPTLELAIEHFADDRNTIGPVKSNGCEVKDGRNCGVRSQTDQVDEHTRCSEKPHRVYGGVGLLVDFVPDSRKGEHFVARVRPYCSGAGLNGCHRCEVENETSGHGEEDAPISPNDVVEDLSYWLVDNICKGVSWITAAVG